MVFVPLVGQRATNQINAEGSAVKRLLDIVRRQRVAGKEQVHVAPIDQFLEVLAGPGVNHGRTRHD